MKKIVLLMFFVIFLIPYVSAENQSVKIYSFFGEGCPHCSKLKTFLDEMESKYPSLEVNEYEVYFNNDNREVFQEISSAYGNQIEGVPTVFIDDKYIVGFSDSIGETIEQEIVRCLEVDCGDPADKIKSTETMKISGGKSPLEDPEKTKLKKNLTLSAVIGAALIDAINPCAFAVLIILLATICGAGSCRKALFAGLAFTASIYISYLLMGIGLYSAIQAAHFTHWFYGIVAVLAILIGLFNLKDYFWYGRWFTMEVPKSWRPKLKGLLRGVTSVPGAFFIGFAVSLFLLPCTSGPYIVILGLLAKTATRNYALGMLLLYNLIFILPMLIITLGVYFGLTTTKKAEEWRKKQLEKLHLIAGVILILLGIGMFIAMSLGMV